MAEEIRLPRVVAEFGLDNQELTERAEEAQTAIANIGSTARNTDTSLPAPRTANVESACGRLTQTIRTQRDALSALMQEYQESALRYGRNSERTQELGERIRTLNTELQNNRQTLQAAEYNVQNYEEAVTETGSATENLTFRTSNLGGEFTVLKGAAADLVSHGLQMVASKLVDIGKSVITTGQGFTSSMSEVAAISGAGEEELEKLTKTAREAGATTQFTASEAAQALKYMGLAGWEAEESIAGLPGVISATAATGMELASVSDLITDNLSAFGMEAQQSAYMADMLTYAQGNSNTSAQQLGEAWANSAANLHAAGQDVETTTSLLEAMANQGIKGSRAGTALSAIMRDITAKMKNGAVQIGETSVRVQDTEGNFRDLTDVLFDVEKAVGSMGTAERAAALSAVFTEESIKGVNLVLNEGMKNVSGYEEALRNSAGAASAAAETMNDNLTGDLRTMDSAFDELKLKIYDSAETPLRSVVQTITKDGVPAIESLIAHAGKLIPVVVAGAAAFGAYKTAIAVQSIVAGVTQAVRALSAAETAETAATEGAAVAQAQLNTVQAANPIGLLVAAIGLLVGGLTSYSLIAGNASSETDKLNESLERARNSAENIQASAAAEAAVIERLNQKYEELRVKTELSAVEKLNLKDVSEQLAEKLGITVEELKDESGEFKNLSEQINKTTESLIKHAEQQARQNLLTAAIETKLKAERDVQEKFNELVEKGLYIQNEEGAWIVDNAKMRSSANMDQINEFNQLIAVQEKAEKAVEEYTQAINQETKTADQAAGAVNQQNEDTTQTKKILDDAKKSLKEISGQEEDWEEKLKSANKKLSENQTEVSNTRKEIEELEEELKKASPKTMGQEQAEELRSRAVQAAQKLTELLGIQKQITAEVNRLNIQMNEKTPAEKYQEHLEQTAKAMQECHTQSSSLKSALSDLSGMYDRLNRGQKLDFDTLINLIDKYPEYARRLSDAADNADLQKRAIEALFEAKKNDYILTQQKAIDTIRASNEETETVIKNIKKQIEAYGSMTVAGGVLGGVMQLNPLAVVIEDLDQKLADSRKDITAYEEKIRTIQNLTIDSFKTGSGYSSGVSSAKTELQKYLDYIDQLKELEQVSLQSEIASYEWALKHYSATADEKHAVDVRLFQARKKLREQEEAAQTEALRQEYDRIDRLAQRREISVRQEIEQLEKINQQYRLTAEQKTALEDKLYEKKKQLRDEEISSLNKLGDAVVAALKNQYQQQKELEEKRLDESIESWKKWEEQTCEAIQGQIDALDDLKNAHDEENQREEYENKRQALELQARYEKDDYNRKQIQKEIAALDKNESERLFYIQIEEQKKALQEQAEAIKKVSSENQGILQNQKSSTEEQYSSLMNDFALRGEAQKFIFEHTQDEIIRLINTYASDYEMLGTALGESLYNGIHQKTEDIVSFVSRIASRTDTAEEKIKAADMLENYLSSADSRKPSVSGVRDIVNYFASVLEQISLSASAYKRQMAVTANAAADQYYSVQKNYSSSQQTSISKPVDIQMNVYVNGSSDSPVTLRRQFEDISRQLAAEIASY